MDQTISSRYLPGGVVDGRYQVTRLLGRGGMAEVYLAHDRLLDRPVAVKVLREHLSGDDRLLTRFRREARAAAGLSHRNIVAVHDVGVDGEAPYIVMELVRGRTLASGSPTGRASPPALVSSQVGGTRFRLIDVSLLKSDR